jgi:multiple sugar transport system substrate-binding protein
VSANWARKWAACLCFLLCTVCGGRDCGSRESYRLTVWFHTGREHERKVIQEQVRQFNTIRTDVQTELVMIPEGSYNGQVQAAALAGDLPDVLEFDGPYVYNYAWQGRLMALDDLLPEAIRSDLLPTILEQGKYRDRLYTIGTYDSGLGLYARRSRLQTVGARIPDSPAEAWTVNEFEAILEKLAAEDADGAVLDLKLNYEGEWFCYGFSPALQSAGADLIDRSNYQSSQGTVNVPKAVDAMRHLQSWILNGWVDPNLDDGAFASGRVTLSWVGHWEYQRYRDGVGDDLVVLPLPDFGEGMRTGQGSWNWGITRESKNPEAAMAFLEFLLQTDQVALILPTLVRVLTVKKSR